jgi:hypothetical protein
MRCASATIAVLLASFIPAVANAVPISITNAGFELPVASNGQFVLRTCFKNQFCSFASLFDMSPIMAM